MSAPSWKMGAVSMDAKGRAWRLCEVGVHTRARIPADELALELVLEPVLQAALEAAAIKA